MFNKYKVAKQIYTFSHFVMFMIVEYLYYNNMYIVYFIMN